MYIFFLSSSQMKIHDEAIHTIAFSSDSSVLLTACTLGNIRFYAVEDDFEGVVQGCFTLLCMFVYFFSVPYFL